MSAKKTKPCKYCAAGERLVGTNHWIVTKIFPPTMKVVKCSAPTEQVPAAKAEAEGR